MQTILLSREEVACRAKAIYANTLRTSVETEANIGKMIIIDIETSDYEIADDGLQAADIITARHPDARLFGIRIGYNVAASLGGIMERVSA